MASQAEPDFLLLTPDRIDGRHWSGIALASVFVHVVIAVLLWPVLTAPAPRRYSDLRIRPERKVTVTPLVVPRPSVLTQKEPNKKPLSAEFNVASITPRPEVRQFPSPGAPSAGRSQTHKFVPPPVKSAPTPGPSPAIPDAPSLNLRANATGPPQGLGTPNAPPAPQIQPQEKPKIAFENPGSMTGTTGVGRIQAPRTSVEDAVRQVARGGGSRGIVVGDEEPVSSGISPGAMSSPIQGKLGSSLELQSDPMGVDFRPYLIRVLSAVKRNWLAVVPESARMGRRGKTVIQFAINKDGGVPKLVIALPSGAEALDRAAVAGISASNPFPPLPDEFRGTQIRLQLNFMYNLQ